MTPQEFGDLLAAPVAMGASLNRNTGALTGFRHAGGLTVRETLFMYALTGSADRLVGYGGQLNTRAVERLMVAAEKIAEAALVRMAAKRP